MKILTVGTTFVDIKGHPDAEFILAGRNSGKIEYVHGGVGRNIAEDIAHLGCGSALLSLIDNSGTAREVADRIREQNIDTSYLAASDGGMGTWLAVFNEHGDVVASISKRPDLTEILNILNRNSDVILKGIDAIVAEIDMGRDIMVKLYDLAEKAGIPIFAALSNIAFALENRDLISKSKCFVCNKMEAEVFYETEFDVKNTDNAALILNGKVKELGMLGAVVTLGEYGAVYADGEGFGFCPPVKVNAVDTTGAGDAFISGVAVGCTSGRALADACKLGAIAASAAVSTHGNVCPVIKYEEALL